MDEAVAKQIHEKVAAVVTWLRTAEEESEEEEEEDEDDVEVVYTEKASKTGIVTETVPNVSEPVLSGEGLILSIICLQEVVEEGEDVDIDAI